MVDAGTGVDVLLGAAGAYGAGGGLHGRFHNDRKEAARTPELCQGLLVKNLSAQISWIEVGIAGVAGGIAGASAIVSAKLASDPGDVLGFFGSAVGAGLAVLGARWLEDRKRRQADLDRIDTLRDAVDFCIRACWSLHSAEQSDRLDRMGPYLAGLRMLMQIKESVSPPDFTVVLWFDALQTSISLAEPLIWDGIKPDSAELEVTAAVEAIETVGRMLATVQGTLDARRAGKRFGDAIDPPSHDLHPVG